MAHVLLLEDEQDDSQIIAQILSKVNPELELFVFKNLAEVLLWIREITGKEQKVQGSRFPDIKEIKLVILKLDFLRSRRLGLIQKFLHFLVRYGFSKAENLTPVIGTLSEIANLKITRYFSPFIWNIAMKPLDELIFESQISMSLEGRVFPKNHLITPYKTKALVELIKPIFLTRISSYGFQTETNRTLPLRVSCKYYGGIFATDRLNSAVARVESCEEVRKFGEIGKVKLSFVGLEPPQISKIRRHLHKSKSLHSENEPHKPVKNFSWLLLDRNQDSLTILKSLFKDAKSKPVCELQFTDFSRFKMEADFRYFSQEHRSSGLNPEKPQLIKLLPSEAFQFTDEKSTPPKLLKAIHNRRLNELMYSNEKDRFHTWLKGKESEIQLSFEKLGHAVVFNLQKVGPNEFFLGRLEALALTKYFEKWTRLSKTPDILFISDEFVSIQNLEFWEAFMKDPQKAQSKAYLLSKKIYTEFEKIKLAKHFEDIFFYPLDQAYIKGKLFHTLSFLDFKSRLDTLESEELCPIDVVHPVPLEEISELGLVVKYDREMSKGSFREFVLLRSYAPASLRIWGSCNACERISDEEWRLHFIFWGTKDLERKEVRRWIRENYVLQKESEGS